MSEQATRTSLCVAACLLAAAWSPAQQFDDGFAKQLFPVYETDPHPPVAFDCDGDGDLDIAISFSGEPPALWRNEGDAGFVAASTALPSSAPGEVVRRMAAADVDGDQDVDLVCLVDYTVRLLLNDGAGNFVDGTAGRIPSQASPMQLVAFADLEGDLDQDLILITLPLGFPSFSRAVVLANNGAGTFAVQAAFNTGTRVDDLAVADFDADGLTDIALAGDSNKVLFRQPSGIFQEAGFPGMAVSGEDVAVGDLDGDQHPDIAVVSWLGLRIYRYTGNRTFHQDYYGYLSVTESTAIALVDADGDADLDVIVGQNSEEACERLYINDGTGALSVDPAFEVWPGACTISSLVADLDGNGHADAALMGRSAGTRCYLGTGSGLALHNLARFPPLADTLLEVVTGDFDGDGDVDLLTGDAAHSNTLRCYRNRGDARFDLDRAATAQISGIPRNLTAGDWDGDGDLDAVAASYQPVWMRNDGSGVFSRAIGTHLGGSLNDLALVDIDGDGDLDLVGAGNNVIVQLNDGAGNFATAAALAVPLPVQATEMAIGDVDGDGDPDLVVGTFAEDRLLRNDGTGSFTDDTAASLPANAVACMDLVLADLDGDGDLDLYQAHDDGGSAPGFDALLLNDGAGHFTPASPGAVPLSDERSIRVVAGDIDDDGHVDLVVSMDSGLRYFRGTGGGMFADASAVMPTAVYAQWSLACADLDRDDDLDLMVASWGKGAVVYCNRHSELRAPRLAVLGHEFALTVSAMPGYLPEDASAALAIGWRLRSVPVPVPPFGEFRLDEAYLQELIPWVDLDPVTGCGQHAFVIPANAAFLGLSIYVQGFVFTASSNYGHLTTATGDVVAF